MNSLDALRKMVDHFPGGRAVVAARLGKTDEVLRKELSGATSHKLGVVDAHSIADMCREAASPHCDALATTIACGSGGFIRLEVRDLCGKQDLHVDMAGVLKETSDAFQVLTEALADDRISDNERARIERELLELMAKCQDLMRSTRAFNEAHKPAHLRAAA